MGLGIVKTSWTPVILPPYSSSIILGYLIYRLTFTHSNITELAPIPSEPPEADQKLRRLTDDEIIQGFRYLMNKDKKKD